MSPSFERLGPLFAPGAPPVRARGIGLATQVARLLEQSGRHQALVVSRIGTCAWLVALGRPVSRCRRLLARAGFSHTHCFELEPAGQEPSRLRPLAPGGTTRSRDILVAASSTAGGSGLPLVDAVFAALDCEAAPELLELRLSDKDKTLVFFTQAGMAQVARVPHSDMAMRAEHNAHRVVEQMHGRGGAIGALLPAPQTILSVNGERVFVEPVMPGAPLAERIDPASRGAWAIAVGPVLAALQQPGVDAQVPMFEAFARPLLDELQPHLPSDASANSLTAAIAKALDGASCRVGAMHGDFSVGNLFVDGARVSGLIDWEDALERAPLALDTCNYLDSVHRRCAGVTLAETIPMLAEGPWPVAAERTLLADAMERAGLAPRHRPGLAMLYWLFHVVPQLRFAQPGDAAHRRLAPVLRWMLSRG